MSVWRALSRTTRAVAAATLGPSAAAVATALVWRAAYGSTPAPTELLQLYVGFFIVGNFILAPAQADGGRARSAALVLVAAAALAAFAATSARAYFRVWPAPPFQLDLLFVGAAGLSAAAAFWLSFKLTG